MKEKRIMLLRVLVAILLLIACVFVVLGMDIWFVVSAFVISSVTLGVRRYLHNATRTSLVEAIVVGALVNFGVVAGILLLSALVLATLWLFFCRTERNFQLRRKFNNGLFHNR